MIYYHLSSRQLKSIENGEGLLIALPMTYDYPADGTPAEQRQWFLDALPDVDPKQIGKLRPVKLWAHLTNRGGSMTGDAEALTLPTRVGEIVDYRHVATLPCYGIDCIVGEIGGKATRPVRWPGGRLVYVKHESDSVG